MEQTQNTQPIIKLKKAPPKLNELTLKQAKEYFEAGLKCSSIKFQSAVDNANKVPENFFSDLSENKERRAETSITEYGFILFKQRNAQGKEMYFGTATANMAHFVCKME